MGNSDQRVAGRLGDLVPLVPYAIGATMLTEHALALDFGVHGKIHGRFRVAVWRLPQSDTARRARRLLRDLLSRPPFAAHEVAELEVVVTELATNAGSYAPGPYELRVLHDHDLPIKVEVADAGGGVPLIERLLHRPFTAPGHVDELELGGRGLRIVNEFTAGRCGARWTRLCGTGQIGTAVWFDLPAHRPRREVP
ncbi:ATP-binding protein [Streptosporangium sp. NBC_01495]|uniref:ATP-binding protein n=1 Tax=Streptosporangium sp. NBC_01495 TaxID=2903899 RepID=UPI002E338793|nr:ATP-binding protein [Streptosporangium sp. NBC_01495]